METTRRITPIGSPERPSHAPRIGVLGSYTDASLGDIAILRGMIEELRMTFGSLSLLVFAFDPDSVAKPLRAYDEAVATQASPSVSAEQNRCGRGRTLLLQAKETIGRRRWLHSILRDPWLAAHACFWWRKYRQIRNLDLLVIGGGNLLMDLYASWPVYLLLYTFLARMAHVPVVFYAVGAGPIATRRGRLYIRAALHMASGVSVRDRQSADLLEKMGLCQRPVIVPDPALLLRPSPRAEPRSADSDTPTLGVNPVPYFDPRYWPLGDETKYRQYLAFMRALVDSAVHNLGCRVKLFGSNFPADTNTAVDLRRILKNPERVEVVYDQPTVDSLLTLCSECDAVLGTRLHVLILSLAANTPFIGLSYQPKVRAFCEEVVFANGVFDLPKDDRDIPELVDRITEGLALILRDADSVRGFLAWRLEQLNSQRNAARELLARLARRPSEETQPGG
jgi:polysaccharide pyruvyl transferase WcaK-like protein